MKKLCSAEGRKRQGQSCSPRLSNYAYCEAVINLSASALAIRRVPETTLRRPHLHEDRVIAHCYACINPKPIRCLKMTPRVWEPACLAGRDGCSEGNSCPLEAAPAKRRGNLLDQKRPLATHLACGGKGDGVDLRVLQDPVCRLKPLSPLRLV